MTGARSRPPDGRADPGRHPGRQLPGLPVLGSLPGESLHFDKRHWAASAVTGPDLEQARRIARNLAGARGWNDRIITETSRALAVVLAGCQPGDMIAWASAPAGQPRTRYAPSLKPAN